MYIEDVIWDGDNVEHLTATSIPEMTPAQEAKFWETHDATDHLDEMEPVTVTVGPRPQNRCSLCGRTLFSRCVDMDLAGNRAQLRGLRQLYCPMGHETRLTPEAQRLTYAVEAVLRLTLLPVVARQHAQVAI